MKEQKQQLKQKGARKVAFRTKPELIRGVNLVKNAGDQPVFQSFLADELAHGKAMWIDSGNNCSTYALNAASNELMRKVEIARCFTPFQHVEMIHQLGDFLGSSTEVLVAPEFDMLYGELNEYEAEELFRDSWKKILELVQENELKLLVSANGIFSHLVEAESDRKIDVVETSRGARYESGSAGTEAYREGNAVQTTIPFWCREEVVHVG